MSPSSSLPLLAKTITHPAVRSLCDSRASFQILFNRNRTFAAIRCILWAIITPKMYRGRDRGSTSEFTALSKTLARYKRVETRREAR